MLRKDDLLIIFGLGFLFILMISIPHIWAFQNSGSDYVFGGFLLNPIDGNSYLAKMYQGWQGNWRFNLPYSAQSGNGGYLFLFYLSLGHLSRTIGTSLQFTFHLARILGAVLMVLSLWHFFGKVLPTRKARLFAYGLALFGTGVGWLAALFGSFTADFWVAEGYPFLSAYANPHFPIGIAIMVWMLTPDTEKGPGNPNTTDLSQNLLLIVAAFVLGIVLPFGIVVVIIVLTGLSFWDFWFEFSHFKKESLGINWITGIFRQNGSFQKLLPVLLGGIPVLVYEVWITNNDPLLGIWNEQNLTISPMLWDTFVSFSPLILVAIPGIYWIVREKKKPARVLLVWVALGFLLMYFPWNLQRRFIVGMLVPLAGLAAIGLDHVFNRSRVLGLAITCLVVLLMLPTNLMILLGGIQAVQVKEPKVILSLDEHNGLKWLESNSPKDALILASPEMGLFIPAYTGRRVLYGHPYETVNARQKEELVLNLLSDLNERDISLADVSYIFYGEREQELAEEKIKFDYELVFSSGVVQIFQVQN
jgi:hypothetical protein